MRRRSWRTTAAAGLLAAAVAISGCSSSDSGGGTPDEPTSGGTASIAINNNIDGQFDVHTAGQDLTGLIFRNVFDSLVSLDSSGEIHPWLAEKWDISEDGKQYTFTLRTDVTFHDGEPFDAAAVKANLDRVVDPATKSQNAAGLLGGEAFGGVEVVDDHTVRIDLNQPYAPLLQNLSTPFLGFYSPAVLDSTEEEFAAGSPDVIVGTGPFRFTAQTPGQDLTFERNADYAWSPADAEHQGPALLDELVFRILPEDATRLGVLASGEAQVAVAISPTDLPTLESNDELEVISAEAPGLPWSFQLNQSRGPLADADVRRAVQRGVDIGSAVEAVYGGVNQRAWSVLTPSTPSGYDASLEGTWEFDPDLAASLLDDAGWTEKDDEGYRTKDGKRLSLTWLLTNPGYQGRNDLRTSFQADLKKIGIEVRLDPQEGAYVDRILANEYDIIDWSFLRTDPDVLRAHLHSGSIPFQNASQVKDDRLDELVTEASQITADGAKRDELYAEAQQIVVDDALIVPVYAVTQLLGHRSELKGLESNLNGWPLLAGAWIAQ